MKKIVVLFLFISLVHNTIQGQNNSQQNNREQSNRANNLTLEQIDEFRNRMNEMFRSDFANLKRYEVENDSVGLPAKKEGRVVFMGNSITEWWNPYWNLYFADKPYINRGIAGQTTAQMLIRFKPDVISLKPKVVVILAGINDINGMTGPTTNKMIEDNISSMVEIAQANKIKVILSSVLPCSNIAGRPDLKPAARVVELNEWIREYAQGNDCIFTDYFSSLKDGNDGLKSEYTEDGVHPNIKGYEIMTPLAEKAIQKALK